MKSFWSKYDKRPTKYATDGSINPDWTPRKSGKSGKGGKHKSKFDHAEFIAWDGEGVTLEDGRHIYVLLANSLGQSISNPVGLSTVECLDFLCQTAADNPHAIHVGYVFSYDASMILYGSCDYETCRRLMDETDDHARKYGVFVDPAKEFRVQYQNRKLLRVQQYDLNRRWIPDPRNPDKMKPNIRATIQLWDVFGFFQSSFVKAVEEWLGDDYPDLPDIREGKLHRGTFTQEQIDSFVTPYCFKEVYALEKIMHKLHAALSNAKMPPALPDGVKITRWDGAGAVAAAMLTANKIKEHLGEHPEHIEHDAAYAYFGGRIEIFRYGHTNETIYHYDIRSAYPYAQSIVPSMAIGDWYTATLENGFLKHSIIGKEASIPDLLLTGVNPFAFCLVEWELSDDATEQQSDWSLYPFPYRLQSGNVTFPHSGRGWYWWPEVRAALDALSTYQQRYPQARISVLEAHIWIPYTDEKPFAWLAKYYDHRAKLKLIKDPSQIVFKLGPNSCYGKTAQHTGYHKENGRRPAFHNLFWAGYITSVTRAKLFSIAMQHPESVLFIATDGLFSLKEHDVPISTNLGDFERSVHDGITIVQSGVYFVHDNGGTKTFCRGFDRGTLDCESVLRAWEERKTYTHFPSTRFIAIKTAVQSKRTWEKRGRWLQVGELSGESSGRKLSLSTQGTKRMERLTRDGTPLWTIARGKNVTPTPAESLIKTMALVNLQPSRMSERYRLPWEYDGEDVVDGQLRRDVENDVEDTLMG